MNRRNFLQGVVTGPAALQGLLQTQDPSTTEDRNQDSQLGLSAATPADTEGHTEVCRFHRGPEHWTVYEDLRSRDGAMSFVGGQAVRLLSKRVEAVFAPATIPYCGLALKEVCLAGPDLLARQLLRQGDPIEAEVRDAAPPMNSAPPPQEPGWRPHWETFLGTSECADTMPVYPAGNTRTYHPQQGFPELTQAAARERFEGLVNGWMPAVRKVFPAGDQAYTEVMVFADVLAKDRFIVQTWHRTARFLKGRMVKVEYGYSYPAYTRHRQPPAPEAFYAGLLACAEYWEGKLADMTVFEFPDRSWSDMARHAFAREQVVRPSGVYPKYGAVDRDYFGPEYDGFQDILTMSLYANLACGRFAMSRTVLNNYFDQFVDAQGMVNMRGPETGQYGLMLFLLAVYARYTGDLQTLARQREKLLAIATVLTDLHDDALRLPNDAPGHGLIHGWCESDACLAPKPETWWKPYYANTAFAVRGLRELAALWPQLAPEATPARAQEWQQRSDALQQKLHASVTAHTKRANTPPYVPPLPGVRLTFRESLATEHPSEQGWPHRCYTELLQAAVLTADQETAVLGTMQAYGAMTLGVVANVEPANPEGREILGFISYGYAQTLLRHDRVEEYLLFLYAHRYHAHSRGSWTAAEVSGITGDGALFCIPAQLTIPLLLRWMLVFEDPEAKRLHFGRAIPRAWVAEGKPIAISLAPTTWGRVNYRLRHEQDQLVADITLDPSHAAPSEVVARFRVPATKQIEHAVVNGRAARLDPRTGDVAFNPDGRYSFTVVAVLAHSEAAEGKGEPS